LNVRGAHTPARGDIVLVELSSQAGHEMAGPHRCIVLSEKRFSVATGYAVICPITTKVKGSPFEVPIPRGLKAVGCVIASEVRTIDYMARNTRLTERAPDALVEAVQAVACAILGCTGV
jgi:mRNA interferase MazF